MTAAFTDDDVQAAADAFSFACYDNDHPAAAARRILAAVAPAIAARALREAAEDMRAIFYRGKTLGQPSDVWLHARADEIERTP